MRSHINRVETELHSPLAIKPSEACLVKRLHSCTVCTVSSRTKRSISTRGKPALATCASFPHRTRDPPRRQTLFAEGQLTGCRDRCLQLALVREEYNIGTINITFYRQMIGFDPMTEVVCLNAEVLAAEELVLGKVWQITARLLDNLVEMQVRAICLFSTRISSSGPREKTLRWTARGRCPCTWRSTSATA